MVIDNADDVETFFQSRKRKQDDSSECLPASLAAYLPQSRNGSILITSRSKDAAARLAGGEKFIWQICAMGEGQGLQLLRNKLQDAEMKGKGVTDLLYALDYIPLAIAQAAAYINRRAPRMTISRYLDEFRSEKKRGNLLKLDEGDLRRDYGVSNSVFLTWQLLFERLRHERHSAADLLSLMSFFNPQGIQESLLRKHNKNAAASGEKDETDEVDDSFNMDLDTLQSYSLISSTGSSDVYEMHSLVQICTQVWLSSFGDMERWKQKFMGLMAQELPDGRFENWTKCQQLIPHIESLYDAEPATDESLMDWTVILTNVAWFMCTKGSYTTAQGLATKALKASEMMLGRDSLLTLRSLLVLACALRDQGKYDEAERLYRRALQGFEKELGVQHPDTLRSVNNLASVLRYQGKYNEAERLNRQVLKWMEKELGEQHPDTLMSVIHLASVLQYQGMYDEAERLNQRALEGCEKKLGVQHPDTLASVNNLALVLQCQGKYDEAERLSRRALEGCEKKLGVQHPDTLASVNNLALVLQCQGKYDEAERLNRRALEGCEKKLGVQHPATLTSVNNLALVLQDQRRYIEAETLNRRALKGTKKELGVYHHLTLTSLINLASVLLCQGKYDELEALSRRALQGSEKELGMQHPHTLIIVSNLAFVLQRQGKHDEAERLNPASAARCEKELGVQHLDK